MNCLSSEQLFNFSKVKTQNRYFNDDRIAGYILGFDLVDETSVIDYTNHYRDTSMPNSHSNFDMMTESKLQHISIPKSGYSSDSLTEKGNTHTSSGEKDKNSSHNITVVQNYELQEIKISSHREDSSIAESEVIDKRSKMHKSSIKHKISELSQKLSR